MTMQTIAERLEEVRARIRRAAETAGRSPGDIRLVGASKRKSAECIREAYGSGLRDFGENYVQELQSKREALADLPDICWHMIGHLQRNKARHVVQTASVVQTVDTPRLAHELGRRAAELEVPAPQRFGGRVANAEGRLVVMVEVNIGSETDKSGCAPAELGEVLDAVEQEPALALAGLMTLPPHTEDPAGARPFFEQMLELREAHGGCRRLPEMSMGMTHDLEVAVATGATIVRVGTAIFGPRT
jgi:pyridoxal phosphate enzyme (YggS family)